MGYYTGSGIVSGGGEKYATLRTFAILGGGSFKVIQKSVYSTTKKSGVSLETARAAHASENLTNVNGGSGTLAWIVFDANGTRSTPTYSKIGDSNLYELNTLDETLSSTTKQA